MELTAAGLLFLNSRNHGFDIKAGQEYVDKFDANTQDQFAEDVARWDATASWERVFNGPPQVADIIRKLSGGMGGLKPINPETCAGLPAPGPATRYWIGRHLQKPGADLFPGVEVTALVPEMVKAGTFSGLLQRRYLVAWPPVNVWAIAVAPTAEAPTAPPAREVSPTDPTVVRVEKTPPVPQEDDGDAVSVTLPALADIPKEALTDMANLTEGASNREMTRALVAAGVQLPANPNKKTLWGLLTDVRAKLKG